MDPHASTTIDRGRITSLRGGSRRGEWRVPLAFIALCALPLLAGGVRLATLAVGAPATPENARFVAAPLPVVAHVVGAAVFIVLGAFQFVPKMRRGTPCWHRRAGRRLVPTGLVTALSALWMTQFYQLPAHDGLLLYGFRIFFGSLMAVSLVLGFIAIRRREFARHRAWMVRGDALGLGAGTQDLTLLVGEIVLGPPGTVARGILMGAAWVINLALAEWVIRRPRPASPPRLDAAPIAGVGSARSASVARHG